ncbi:MAG: DUF6434 domain-containing protein [Pseudomonadota bacterium]
MTDEQRPAIETITTGAELTRWYWLKAELEAEFQRLGLPTGGSKQDLTDRLAHFLDTDEVLKPKKRRSESKFNWARETLTRETIITDSYRNGPNVRTFFEREYGPDFKFNIAFMAWMKANVGKTLGDAIEARRTIAEREQVEKPPIPASNQYNAYTRAFHQANPERTAKDARACWAWKRAGPGHNRYEDSDLIALKESEK